MWPLDTSDAVNLKLESLLPELIQRSNDKCSALWCCIITALHYVAELWIQRRGVVVLALWLRMSCTHEHDIIGSCTAETECCVEIGLFSGVGRTSMLSGRMYLFSSSLHPSIVNASTSSSVGSRNLHPKYPDFCPPETYFCSRNFLPTPHAVQTLTMHISLHKY